MNASPGVLRGNKDWLTCPGYTDRCVRQARAQQGTLRICRSARRSSRCQRLLAPIRTVNLNAFARCPTRTHADVSKLRQKTIKRIANPLVEVNLAEAASRELPCTFALVTDEDVLSIRRDTEGSGFSPRLPYSIV
jgi:hypothetical protein